MNKRHQLKFVTLIFLGVGLVCFAIGVRNYMFNVGDSALEKVGVVLFTTGALFIGMAVTSLIAYFQER